MKVMRNKKAGFFGIGLTRFAVCALMALVGVVEARGKSVQVAPINPAFKQWQKERRQKQVRPMAQTNTVSRKAIRLLPVAKNEAEDGEDGFFGLAPSMFDSSYLSDINISADRGVADSLPVRYDLRDRGLLTPVKNQGHYGTCWAHATLASLESGLLINEKGVYDISEKNMVMLHGGDWMFDDGGNADRSSAYLLRWEGPVLESEDPYPSDSYYWTWFYDNHYWSESLGEGEWVYKYAYALDSILPKSVSHSPAFHVQNVRWIPKRNSYLDNDAIKEAVATLGALHVSYYHSDDYYKPSTAAYYNSVIKGKTNHAVALVGWDDNYSAKNFAKTPPGNGAFIVRNSWGTGWGDGGYFYVSYYDESFAWNTLYNFSNVESADNYDSIYEYDPLGLVGSVGYGSVSAWGANMFQAASATKISAVGFYALAPNTTYTIYVYTGSTAGLPRSGTPAATQSGKSEYAGYVTVPLSSPPSVSARQRFSVVVQLTTPGYNSPLACEYAHPEYTSEATASSGQSFLSQNGSKWFDFTSQVEGSPNFCCKAYTKSATLPNLTLSAIAISGVSSLTSGQTATFTCEATYTDGSKQYVTSLCSWSISGGRDYATISADGIVTAKSVTAEQRVTVKASYTEGGVTKEASWGFYVTIAAPDAPTGVTATQGTETSCVRVNWTAPSGATEYAVYRATANDSSKAQYLGTVTVSKYNDTTAIPGVDYWYFIKAKNSSGTSDFSAGVEGWRKLSPPDEVTASDDLTDKVRVTWLESIGAKAYRVYRADGMDEDPLPISGWLSDTTFDDTTADAGVVYCYYVVAAVDASGIRPSDYSIIEDGMRAVPVTVESLSISGAATIPSNGDATYKATAKYTDGKAKDVTPSSWSISPTTYASVSGGKVTAKTVTANQSVTLTATYSEGGKTVEGVKGLTITATVPAVPTGLKVTLRTVTGISLSWSGVAEAASYKVYRAAGNDTANEIGTSSVTTFIDTTATPGVAYQYSVAAVNGAGESARSGTVYATVPLSAPTGVTATTDRTDGVVVAWQPSVGATHYRVARATSATGAKAELGAWQGGLAYTDATATAGSRYWYFVRAATSSSGANASGYSDAVEGARKVVVTLSSIAISGPKNVTVGQSELYSCTATYSDGSTKNANPVWTVSPASAATIDANGKLAAKVAATNASVVVTASFTDGVTKTATKPVAILALAATADIQDVNVVSRWPFAAILDIDYTLAVDPAGATAAVNVFGRDEDHGVDIAARSLEGDGADGSYIPAGPHSLSWDVGADYPDFHAQSFSVTLTATPSLVAVPDGFTASGDSTAAVNLSWQAVAGASGYEIWRGTGTTTNGAARIAVVTGATTYMDTTATAGTTYRYWIRAMSEYGAGEFSQSVTGTRLKIVPVSLSISGASSVTAGGTATYTCMVSRNDGTSGTVTPTWSVSSGGAYASINSSGTLTAKGIATQQSVKIQASYTQNGTTKTATKTVTINTKSVTITFNPGGGTVSPASKSYVAYGTYASLPTATRTGYTFAGWWTAASGGAQVTTASTVPASAATLYAHWTANAYTIRFNANGGTGAMSDLAMTYGIAKTLTANAFSYSMHQFEGWANSSAGAVKYSDRQIVSNLASAAGARVELYAKWREALPQSLRIDGADSVVDGTPAFFTCAVLLENGESFSVTPTWRIVSGDNCSFGDYWNSELNVRMQGLYASKTVSPREIVIGADFTTNGVSVSGQKTITVMPIMVTIEFDGNGGSTPVDKLEFSYYGKVGELPVPERSGYDFAGWYLEPEDGVEIQEGDDMHPNDYIDGWHGTANRTLYAHWTHGEWTIQNGVLTSYASNGSKFANVPSTVKSIAQGVFSRGGSEGLLGVSIPASVTNIVTEDSGDKFINSPTVRTIAVDPANAHYCSDGSILFDKNKTKVLYAISGIKDVALPQSVKEIGNAAFRDCREASISLPAGLERIGDWALYYCTNITELTLPSSVEWIGRYSFCYCKNLKSLTVASTGQVRVGAQAFGSCLKLESVTFLGYRPYGQQNQSVEQYNPYNGSGPRTYVTDLWLDTPYAASESWWCSLSVERLAQ